MFEGVIFFCGENAGGEKIHGFFLLESEIFGDPVQGVQVALAAFAIFDIGFDHVS